MNWNRLAFLSFVFSCMGRVAWSACTIDAIPVSFGSYDPISGSPTTAVGEIDLACDVGEPFQILLDRGVNASDFLPRLMRNLEGREIQYNLYTAPDYQTIWGDDTQGTSSVIGVGGGTAQTIFVHGRIPGGQNVPVGSYNDTVTATVRF